MKRRTKGALALGVAALALAGLAALAALTWPRRTAGFVSKADYPDVTADADGDGSIDWDALRAEFPDVVAWVSVAGTPIDYPVLQSSGGEADDFYLTHAPDRSYSSQGSAYLDVRAQATVGARLVFAHHMGDTGLMFSSISKAWREDVFRGVGEMEWSTPDGQVRVLRPVMAMVVDETYQPIQRFGFLEQQDMADWLEGLSGDASVLADDAREVVADASDVVTLCTCASDASGQRQRTLLVFAG